MKRQLRRSRWAKALYVFALLGSGVYVFGDNEFLRAGVFYALFTLGDVRIDSSTVT